MGAAVSIVHAIPHRQAQPVAHLLVQCGVQWVGHLVVHLVARLMYFTGQFRYIHS